MAPPGKIQVEELTVRGLQALKSLSLQFISYMIEEGIKGQTLDRIVAAFTRHQTRIIGSVLGSAGIAGGAEMILIPEVPFQLEDVERKLEEAYVRGKAHCIIVIAEGARPSTREVAAHLREREEEHGFEVRVTILGHIQRGGSPTAFERLLATRLGAAAVEQLLQGKSGVMVGLVGNKIAVTDLEKVLSSRKELDLAFYKLAERLER